MIKTITTKEQGKVSFLFGVRFISLLQKSFGIKNLEDIGQQLENPTLDDVATMLYLAHENACFYMRNDLTIESGDRMLFLVDEVGMEEVMNLLADGLSDMTKVGGSKKKVSPAKRTSKSSLS